MPRRNFSLNEGYDAVAEIEAFDDAFFHDEFCQGCLHSDSRTGVCYTQKRIVILLDVNGCGFSRAYSRQDIARGHIYATLNEGHKTGNRDPEPPSSLFSTTSFAIVACVPAGIMGSVSRTRNAVIVAPASANSCAVALLSKSVAFA